MFYLYRRQIRVFVTLLLLAALAYGAVKGWMHYRVAQAMDDLALQATGRAEITYRDIDTELSGVVWVRGINVLPEGAPQPLHIDAVRVSAPDPTFFLWDKGEQGDMPPRLRVDVMDVRVGLDPALLDTLQPAQLPGGAGPAACSPGGDTDPAVLRDIGVEQLLINAAMSYDYQESERRLDAHLEFDVQGIERVEADMVLGDVAPGSLGKGAANMESIPTLVGASMNLRIEPEFAKRYLAACAERRGLDVAAYRDTLVDETLAQLSRVGLQLGSGLRQAMQTYHRDWGDLRVSLEPPAPLNPMMLLFASPSDWQRTLGMKVAVNRVPVSDMSFDLRPPNADELAVMMGEQPPPKPVKPRDRYRYVYRDIPATALAQHLGAEVRLELRGDQPERSGVLVAIGGGEARVEQRLHGGKITAHVSLDDIARVQVRQVEKIPAK